MKPPTAGQGRDFVIFFEQKEGTTAIVRRLNGFPGVDVIRSRGTWEPFSPHACGAMGAESMRTCIDRIFSRTPLEAVNEIYQQTAERRLSRFDPEASLGFKVRYHELPDPAAVIEVLKRHDVLVFLAVRQNVFRWALSTYHGTGTGAPGHLQFRLASGQVERHEIPRIAVDPGALEAVIQRCERLHVQKREFADHLRGLGFEVVPLRYEDFLADQRAFFAKTLHFLGRSVSDDEMDSALGRDIRLRRVHGDDLSEFFTNADELEARFGDRFEAWP